MKISLLINMKMPTFVGIFIFISKENFMLSWVEHEKSFITSGLDIFVLHYIIQPYKFTWHKELIYLLSKLLIA